MAEVKDSALVYSWSGPPSLELWRDRVRHREATWEQHRLVTQGGAPGAVALVARDDSLLWVRHWRPVLGAALWELPRGFGDRGEAPEETAAREVHEETGYRIGSPRVLGWISPDSGLLAGSVAAVAALVGAQDGAPDGEVDAVRWFTEEDIVASVRDGGIRDGISLAAFAFWQVDRHRSAATPPDSEGPA